jgi:hypothetical protein
MNILPKQTVKIFETLSKGQFISSNSSNSDAKELYECIDSNFEPLFEYFAAINFQLERGNEYFHFSRTETKVDLERKIENAYRWIDILDFFKAVDPSFGAGSRVSPSAIAEQCKVNSELKMKLEAMKKITGEDNLVARIRKLLDNLKRDDFVELENEMLDSWKVLTSIHYIESIIQLLTLNEENETAE